MMKKIRVIAVVLVMLFSFLQSDLETYARDKKEPVEELEIWDDEWHRFRSYFGLIAENVSDVKLSTDLNEGWSVFFRQGNDHLKEVDFFYKEKNKKCKANYRTYLVSKKAKEYFPMHDELLILNQRHKLLLTSVFGQCYLFANHRSKKDCQKSGHRVFEKVVRHHLNPQKCWSDSGMFAYVKNNNLYMTGVAMIPEKKPDDKIECWQYDKPRVFFQGKANGIKKVVCGEADGLYGNNFFVLMKDGSVWGMGNNRKKLVSNAKRKYYDDFVCIIPKQVKKIAAGNNNVAIIKENNDLYVWGHTMKSKSSKQYKNSAKPKKIASNIKEVAISGLENTTMVYVKRNGKAYGLGMNEACAFTERYKLGWHKKPVKLMENVRHAYCADGATVILKKNKKLYWTGRQTGSGMFYWVHKKLSGK